MSVSEAAKTKDDEVQRDEKEMPLETVGNEQQASTSACDGESNSASRTSVSSSTRYSVDDLRKLKIHIEIKKPKTEKQMCGATFDPNLIAPVRRPDEGKVPIFSKIPVFVENDGHSSKGGSLRKKYNSDKKKSKSDREKRKRPHPLRSRSRSPKLRPPERKLRKDYFANKEEYMRLETLDRMKRDLNRQQNRLRSPSESSSTSSSDSSSDRGQRRRSRSESSRSRSLSRSSEESDRKRDRSHSEDRRRRRRSGSRSRSSSINRDRRHQSSQDRGVRNEHRRRDQDPDSMGVVPYLPDQAVPWPPRNPYMRPFIPGPAMPMYPPPMMYAPPNFRPFPPIFRGAPRNRRP